MDLWATGCVMYELTCLRPLFPGSNELDQVILVINKILFINYVIFFSIFICRFIEFMRFWGVRAKKFWINFFNFAIVRFLGIFQRWINTILTFSKSTNSNLDHWERYWAGDRVSFITCWDQRFIQIDQIWPWGANHGSSGAAFWVVQNRAQKFKSPRFWSKRRRARRLTWLGRRYGLSLCSLKLWNEEKERNPEEKIKCWKSWN